ncbi:MAG: hypothetical protein M0Z40_16205 [Actinomycetota bacterium]|nr:hypothetical protein [Actinomycetota bacterium]
MRPSPDLGSLGVAGRAELEVELAEVGVELGDPAQALLLGCHCTLLAALVELGGLVELAALVGSERASLDASGAPIDGRAACCVSTATGARDPPCAREGVSHWTSVA